jgi:hypothetical protein
MTAVALRSKAAFVFVVLPVAADAQCRGRDLLLHTFVVARIAIEPFVSAVEFEAGAGIMIKIPDFPVPDVVTVLALGA